MKHSVLVGLSVAMLVSGPVLAGQPARTSQIDSLLGDTIPRSVEAMTEVDECASEVKLGPVVELCNRTWRGIRWSLLSSWNAQLDTPTGLRWFVRCKYNAIDRSDDCTFFTGDEFAIVRGNGNKTIVFWGLKKYPSSPMTARFDDAAPISTSREGWMGQDAISIYSQMREGRIMRYRFSNWPDGAAHDGAIDLTGFSDVAALMEAIRDQFTVSRVLKKIEVAQ